MTSGTVQQKQLEQAMEHFGLGDQANSRGIVDPVYIIASVERLSIKTMFVRPIDPRTGAISDERPRELMREQVHTEYFNINDHALIKIPRAIVAAFWLYDYLLNEDEVDDYQRKVAKHYL